MEKSLICITTCNRLDLIKRFILPIIDFCRKSDSRIQFLLSLDGNNQEYIDFSETYAIPLLFSEDREGVGVSKNRVLKQFPDYDFYFFLDDDVELYDPSIFSDHIEFVRQNKQVHHLSATDLWKIEKNEQLGHFKVIQGKKGGGYFNFFTREGLEKVGGWHTDFAQWKRFGHTEHSYRFVNAGLQEYPFVVLEDSINKVIIHSPEHVSEPLNHLVDPENELFEHEKHLIDQKLSYFPLSTLSPYYFNGKSLSHPGNELITKALASGDRYYLVNDRSQKRQAKVAFKVFELGQKSSFLYKVKLLLEIVFLAPTNNAFKHWIKQKFRKTRH